MIRFALVAACWAAPALADVTPVRVELNSLAPAGDACRMTFTAESAAGLDALRLETVLFDRSGGVLTLTIFDFQDLPAGRPRVRQFDMPGLDCGALGRVLFNGVDACTQGGVACAGLPEVGSRLEVEVLG